MNRRATKWYLAGPFFNSEQIKIMERIEAAFKELNVAFFSPREQHGCVTQPVPIDNREMAEVVFKKNYEQILECTHMLAVLDYALPAGDSVAMVNGGNIEKFLSLPDTGTVWEMGVAYACRIPTIGFTERPHGYLNLMMTQSMKGVCNGRGELLKMLADVKKGDFQVPQWEGSYR